MSLNTLKIFRILVPGIIIFALLVLLIPTSYIELKSYIAEYLKFDIKDFLFTATFIVFGIIYHITELRNKIWFPLLKKVRGNINDSLLAPFLEKLSDERIKSLKKDRKLLNVFYYFIDNFNSLDKKSNLVRFNGLIWTSFIDLLIISLLGALVVIIKLLFIVTNYHFYLFIGFIAIALISLVPTFALGKKHIRLSNEQLEIITEQYKKELKQKLDDIE